MSQRLPTSLDDVLDEIWEQVATGTPDAIREAIASQLGRAREARQRVEDEGSVVRDMKGAAVPHPGLKVESDAIKLYASLMAKHGA